MATVYTVKKGDTLPKIAQKYGTTTSFLAKLNGIKNPNYIVVGQKIQITADTTIMTGATNTKKKKPTIKAFGLQNGTERTIYATWTWTESGTDHYEIQWYYATGNGVSFIGNKGEIKDKQSTYDAPSNAITVKFRVKPIAKDKKKNNKTQPKWYADWSDWKEYAFTEYTGSPTVPEKPTVTIEGTTMKLSVNHSSSNAKEIEFQICYTNGKVLSSLGVKIVSDKASTETGVPLGGIYKVRCKSIRGKLESDWSDWSDEVGTGPASPGAFTVCRAESKNSIYLEWPAVATADSYTIQYTNDIKYFDTSDQVTEVSDIPLNTRIIVLGDENSVKGSKYYFRVKSVNANGSSPWSAISDPVIIGTKPSPPTTWSFPTVAITGETVELYWVHNTQDESEQSSANISLTISGTSSVIPISGNTCKYTLDTSSYTEGTKINWKVQTAGITGEYSDWSIERTIDVYAKPVLVLSMEDSDGNQISTLDSFPFVVKGVATPNTQKPIGYSLSIIANELYETVDYLGNTKTINKGETLYSNFIDTSDQLSVTFNPSDVDLEDNIEYIISCVVSMDSGLDAEASWTFSVKWLDELYLPNAEIIIDEDKLTASVRPFVTKRKIEYYKVNYNSSTNKYEKTSTVVNRLDGETVNDALVTILTDYKVYKKVEEGKEPTYFCIVPKTDENDIYYYEVNYDETSGLYIKTSDEISEIKGDITQVGYASTEHFVFRGTQTDGTEIFFCIIITDIDEDPDDDILLSVYRREFDGSFTEIGTNIDNKSKTFVTDPHPSLDYARYRIVATTSSTGAVCYYDVPGVPIREPAIVIQWDEQWSDFDTTSEDELVTPPLAGSMLKLKYNVDVTDKNDSDKTLVEYIGRKHPVGYYGTQLGVSANWSTEIPKSDKETIYGLRRLMVWMGDVYVREPSGSGYWATINVSFSQKHCELTVPISIDVTRVEGGK